jgi:hypothetical protein
MDKLAPQFLYEILSFLSIDTLFKYELVNADMRRKLKNNPYFLREIVGLTDNETYEQCR